jgi:hypothetical protein
MGQPPDWGVRISFIGVSSLGYDPDAARDQSLAFSSPNHRPPSDFGKIV